MKLPVNLGEEQWYTMYFATKEYREALVRDLNMPHLSEEDVEFLTNAIRDCSRIMIALEPYLDV